VVDQVGDLGLSVALCFEQLLDAGVRVEPGCAESQELREYGRVLHDG
jgi:hypothetical protein